jgi:hypothetical protein
MFWIGEGQAAKREIANESSQEEKAEKENLGRELT